MENNRLKDIFNNVIPLIEKLPDPPRESIKKEIEKLMETFMEARPPRLLVIGRRGAGKSSLINAIFNIKVSDVGSVKSTTGKSLWHYYKNKKGEVHILDTRGLGDSTIPESSNFKNSIDEIKDSINEKYPDVILFLCKAKEVDARINDDIENMIEIKEYIYNKYNYSSPIIGIVNQVDELDPVRINEPPFDDVKKQQNIEHATNIVKNALKTMNNDVIKIFPLCTYAEYEDEKMIYQRYWNIEGLTDYLTDALPESAQLEFARLSAVKSAQRKVAKIIVNSASSIAGGIGATPIPFADLPVITSLQIGMVMGVGYIAGRELNYNTAKEFLTALGVNIGAAFVLRESSRALAKFVFPGVGNTVSGIVAFAGTYAIGEAAIAYFIDEKSIDVVKEIFEKSRERKKQEIEQK